MDGASLLQPIPLAHAPHAHSPPMSDYLTQPLRSSDEDTSWMTDIERFDAVVIGAGQGGVPLAGRLAEAGWKTALVEREHVGGTCVNFGCTPTKTMVASARVADLTRRAAEYGILTGSLNVDQSVVRQRKRAMVESFRRGSERALERWEHLELIRGEARFAGPRQVNVELVAGGSRRIVAESVFINAGARASFPAITGLESVHYLTSSSVTELESVPDHLIVIGGGYVGVEFGQMFRRFGSKVTIVHSRTHLLALEDEDVSSEVANILRNEGIELMLESRVESAEPRDAGILVHAKTSEGKCSVAGSHLLVATGRVPNSDTLDLEKSGVITDERGYIVVNGRLETNVSGIYALGDIKGGPQFTHVSYDDFRVLQSNLLEGGSATTEGRMVPHTVFTDPQLGRVGLSEREARARGVPYRVAKMQMTRIARALEVGETRGFVKVLVDPKTEQILGCAVLGVDGGEIMSMIQIAMLGHLPYSVLRDAIFAHPTLAEGLNNVFATLSGE
jgi:pyruvate/2-oxoglutarate dehydrogenase complex dihydrolipoamide dehydrogenase (E3) component